MSNIHIKLKERIQILKKEFNAGQKMMVELEQKQAHLHDTLLRISGAIQVLEEFLMELDGKENAIKDDNESQNQISDSAVTVDDERFN